MQPIVGAIKNGYDVETTIIATTSLIYMAIFVVFNFPSNIALDRYGLRVGILLGVTLTAIGMWIKAAINRSFDWVLVG